MQAPGPTHSADPAAGYHDCRAAVAPCHLVGQVASDDRTAIRGIEAGIASPVQVLPDVVVDGRCSELVADSPQQPVVPAESGGPERKVNFEHPSPEPPLVQPHERGPAFATHR